MTQCERVMAYIELYGSITSLEAFQDLGITRLASRISDLSSMGVQFDRTTEKRKNRFGEWTHYTRYSLKG